MPPSDLRPHCTIERTSSDISLLKSVDENAGKSLACKSHEQNASVVSIVSLVTFFS